ncbi:unnamed protein product, partial [Rotaria sp. Silwood2]
MELFNPFHKATNLFSGSKYPTIGLCLYTIPNIKEFFEKENENQSNIFMKLKTFILESLNHYFNENIPQVFLLT